MKVSRKALGTVSLIGLAAGAVSGVISAIFGPAQREQEIQDVVRAMPLEDRFESYLAAREKSPEETEV